MELTPRRNEILRQVERFFYSEASSEPSNPAYSQSLLFLRVLSRMSDIDVDALAASLYDGDKWHAMFTLFTNAVLDSVDTESAGEQTNEVNARLASSAPEMYRILREIQDWCRCNDLNSDIEADISEVLARVDGEEAEA